MILIVLLDSGGLLASALYAIQKWVACQATWLGARGAAILTLLLHVYYKYLYYKIYTNKNKILLKTYILVLYLSGGSCVNSGFGKMYER